jgi:hypothetical protein
MKYSKKIYISIITFAIIALIFFVFIIIPIFKNVNKDAKEFLAYKEDFLSAEDKIENLKKLSTIYKNYQQNLDKIDSLFIDKDVPVDFIKFLENTAQNFQLFIKVSSVGIEENKDELGQSLSFQISAYGSFSNFLKFLGKLENGPYLIEVRTLNIAKLVNLSRVPKEVKNLSPDDINVSLILRVAAKSNQ